MNHTRIIAIALLLVVAPHVHAADSHAYRVRKFYCMEMADSASFIVASAKAGATDAQIQADMNRTGMMMFLTHSDRLVLERQPNPFTLTEVFNLMFKDCMKVAQ